MQNGLTPLHVAAHYDNQKVALLLLEKGASPHATAKVRPHGRALQHGRGMTAWLCHWLVALNAEEVPPTRSVLTGVLGSALRSLFTPYAKATIKCLWHL